MLGSGWRAKRCERNPLLGCGEKEVVLREPAPQILLLQQECRVTWPATSPMGAESEGEDFPSRQELCCVPRAAGEEGWELQQLRDMGFSSAARLRATACCPAAAKELSHSHKNTLGRKGRMDLEPHDAGAMDLCPVGLPPTPTRRNEPAPVPWLLCPPQLPAEKATAEKDTGGSQQ